jgi:hypothetical protein
MTTPNQILDYMVLGKSYPTSDLSAHFGGDSRTMYSTLTGLAYRNRVKKVKGIADYALWEKLPEEEVIPTMAKYIFPPDFNEELRGWGDEIKKRMALCMTVRRQ